ncbi:MAG: hypothetical protein QE271_11985 [Bacteriovoracaceae bacterium]|nr:hypothetical protein [Bacteriovoracaceae bacterium]
MRRKLLRVVILGGFLFYSQFGVAQISDGSGWANYVYLVKIYGENLRRYYQLKEMIQQAHRHDQYIRILNEGLNGATGLMEVLPVRDERILSQIREFQGALSKIEEIYGLIPKSSDEALQRLHDLTIAESLKISIASRDYAEVQESNAQRVFVQSAAASPKGAARMAAQANAQILHSLSQLLRLNGQMLKMQSESFALTNKEEKDSSENFNKTKKDLGKAMNKLKPNYEFPRF